jgi:general secretion pathway protein M
MNGLLQWKSEITSRVMQSGAWQHWRQLPPRDRLALMVLAAFFALVLFYAFIWLPIDRKLDSANVRYLQEREFLSYLREHAPTVSRSTRSARPELSPEQLQGVITSTAQKHGLVLQRLDSEGSGRLLIALAQTPFESLLRWLAELEGKGVALREVSLERSGVGKVDARLTMAIEGA